jgi:MFS family permease
MNGAPVAGKRVAARHIAAVVVGNAIEFYDFLTFSFFAVYIGHAFFPSDDPTTSLLATLATFGAGFFTRPIGAFVIGRMGDRLGRKPAMFLSFWLMGVAIVGLALTPPRSMIGVAAPILVVLFRLLQGFALGGEVGPTTTSLLELAPLHRRGFYTAFQAWSQHIAMLVSGLVGVTLSNLLNTRQLEEFGWRVAMLIGATVIPVGLAIRRSLPETLPVRQDTSRQMPGRSSYVTISVLGLMMILGGVVGAGTSLYATTYAITTLHLKANIAFAGTLVIGFSGLLIDLTSGALSDRIGRKPILLAAGALLCLSIVPAFQVMLHYRSATAFLAANSYLTVLGAFAAPVIVAWLTESLPPAIRSGTLAIVYATSAALFGGTTQFVITWLIRWTGNPMAPAWYWTAAALVGFAAAVLARESAPCKISHGNEIVGELERGSNS